MPSLSAAEQTEKARRLLANATKISQKADYQFIVESMRKYPQIVPELKKTVDSLLGFAAVPPATLPLHQPEVPALVDREGGSHPAGPQPAPPACETQSSRKIPDQHNKLNAFPLKDLQFFMKEMEPILFSPFAVKALCKRGARCASKASLCELIEFTTGLEANARLAVNQVSTVDDCARILKALNFNKGRRAQDLELPPCWETQGVYTLEETSGGQLVVVNRFKKVAVTISGESGFKFGMCKVEPNFSEDRARLMQDGIVDQPLLITIFAKRGNALCAKVLEHSGESQEPSYKKIKLTPSKLKESGASVCASAVSAASATTGSGGSSLSQSLGQLLGASEAPSEGTPASSKGLLASTGLEAHFDELRFEPPAPPAEQ